MENPTCYGHPVIAGYIGVKDRFGNALTASAKFRSTILFDGTPDPAATITRDLYLALHEMVERQFEGVSP